MRLLSISDDTAQTQGEQIVRAELREEGCGAKFRVRGPAVCGFCRFQMKWQETTYTRCAFAFWPDGQKTHACISHARRSESHNVNDLSL